MPLMLGLDASSLTMSLVNIASPHGAEGALADSVQTALEALAHLSVERIGNTVVAATHAGHGERVLVAARLDTAGSEEPPLAFVEMGKLYGVGSCDAKGCAAVMLKAASLGTYRRDVTFVFYDGGTEGADEDADGLSRLARERRELIEADVALLMTPTDAAVAGPDREHPLAETLIALTEVPATSAPAGSGPTSSGLASVRAVGIPAVAFGPGDPAVAGAAAEFVPTAQLSQCEFVLRRWLTD